MRASGLLTRGVLLALCIMLAGTTAASATTLFYDGFEGGVGNWTTSGVGLVAYQSYWGTWSLETDNSDYAIRAQSTVGYTGITLELYHKTTGFDVFPQDYVHVEYSPNAGANWYNLQSWTSNFDWSYRAYALPSSCDSNPYVMVKLRAQTNSNDDNIFWDEIYIKGTPAQYTLTTSVVGSGSVTKNPNQSTYTYGTNVQLTANAGSGWAFSSWSGDASGSTNPYTISMTSNKSVTANFTDIAPAAPTGLAATPGDNSVSLNWNDNTEADLDSYRVYRSITSGSGYSEIANGVAASAYVDNTAANGTTYYYVVKAQDDGSHLSGYSNEASATPVDTTPPAAPTGLTATGGDNTVSLDWANNVEADLAYYRVYRSITSGSGYSLLNGNVPSSAYVDNTAANGTTYYYVVTAVDTASNASGYSSQASATPADTVPPAAPTGLAATAGDGSVSLDWANNTDGDFASYSVYRSTTSGSGYASIATAVATSAYIDNTVTNGTTYYYVVTAVDDDDNESGYSAEASATPTDQTPPAAPTGLAATAGDNEVSLDWADNGEGDFASYSVYRSTTSGSGYASIATSLAASAYVDSTAVNGTTYYYVVTATDTNSNESAYSAEASATPVDVTAPAAPTGLAATPGDNEVSLDWADNSEGDLASYNVYRSTTSGSGYTGIATAVATSNYVDSTAVNLTTYYYVVTAVDDDSNESAYSGEASATPVDTIAPAVPSGLSATGGDNVVNLDWTDNSEPDLAGYNVSRADVTGGPYTEIASLVATSAYVDNTATNGNTYYYVVTAEDNVANESGYCTEDPATPGDTTPPAAPTGLAATGDDGSVSLDWADNTEGDLASYTVYRSTTSGSGYASIATALASSAYVDNTVTNGTTYYYVVTAVDDDSNESTYSAEASATPADTTPPAAPTGLAATAGDGSVSLDWADNTEGDLASYSVYRSTTSGSGYASIATAVASSAYVDNTVTNGTTYYYVVTAVDDDSNESAYSTETTATPTDSTPPAAPTGLAATAGDASVSLDWADNTEPDLASYSVYRSTTSGSGYASIATAVATSGYVDNTAANGTTYYYVVTAVDANSNESGFSNEASATPVASDTTPPAIPANLVATRGTSIVSLNWDDNTEPDLNGYNVYRATVSGGPYTEIASLLVVSNYDDTNVTNGTMYYYVVAAEDDVANESGYSSQVSAMPSIQYTLTTSVNGGGHIDNTNPGPYYYGDTTTLFAVADSGNEFAEWSGTVASTSNPIDVTFTQNHSITAHFQTTPSGPVLGVRVLLLGDSWANIMWNDMSLSDVFTDAGFPYIYEVGTNTAVGGTTAAYWAQSANLQTITNSLNAFPSIDMVHFSMGGNDMLAGQSYGGWYKGMGSSAEAALLDTIKANTETVIQHILNIRPEIRIVISSYDYLNLLDTLNIQANQLLWANLGQPTPRELNDAFIKLGDHQHELAIEYGASVTYVNNWGLMHALHGYNTVFPAYRYGVPWGHPNYPWPKSMGANNGDDPIHLNTQGYYELSANCWDKFYRYLIDPNAGPLPADVDSYPPPPPSQYTTFFSDGFEDYNFTVANWNQLNSVGWKSANTWWGTWSLELDKNDSAVLAKSTAGYDNIRVQFNLKTGGHDTWPVDYFYLDYTTNYGASWTTLESWTSNFDWSFREYLLPATADNNASFGIRFRSVANSTDDDNWIDEVKIQGQPLPCTLYTLTRLTDGRGSVSAAPGPDYGVSYCSGTQVTLTATPKSGWTFTGWSGGASGTTNPVTITMNGNKSVTATFVDSHSKPGLSPGQYDWMRWVSMGIDVDAFGATWPAATAAQASSLLYKANVAQNIFETYHMPYGQAADMWYSDYTRTQCNKYETLGDSTAMLGYYIGGLCNKYAVTNDASILTQIDDCLDTLWMLSQCSGKSGYVVRFAGLTSDPAYQQYYQGYGNGYGTCVAPWQNYTWLDYSSRDTYTGFAFAIGNVWIHIGDANIRAKAQAVFEPVMDRLLSDSWNIISPTGKFTNWTYGIRTTYTRIAISMNNAKYGPKTSYGSDFWWWEGTGGMNLDDMYYGDYFANILKTCDMYVCLKLETNTDKINTLTNKLLACAEADGGKHLNAHLAACYLAATGHSARNVPKGVLQGCLIDFQSGDQWMKAVNNGANPLYPHKDSTFSTVALMVQDRPGCDYQWQKSPAVLSGGADVPIAFQTFDQFTPYWMGRKSGAIPAP